MTAAEYFTYQFYTWEYRGRGWHVSELPVYLEPPFIPFFRHGQQPEYIDDGKRHTFISRLLENIKGKKPEPTFEASVLNYEELEPYIYEEEPDLKALQIKLPKERKITPEKMKALIVMLSSCNAPISFEIIGTATEIIIQFVCTEPHITTIETFITAYFPDCAVLCNDNYVENILEDQWNCALVDFGLKEEFVRPILSPKNFNIDPLTGLIGVLEQLLHNEHGGVQVLFQGVVNQWRDSIIRGVTLPDGSSFFADDPIAPKLALEKVQSLLFGVTIRAFGQAPRQQEALQILEKISHALLQGTRGQYNQLIPLPTETYDFQTRFEDIYLRQSHRLGMLLNADELATILHFPSESVISKKLFNTTRKTIAVPAIAKNKTYILGENVHNGITTPVSFSIEDRVKHTHIIGATGTGKSTLIANLILQDIRRGLGLVLFDPHGDLIDDVIALLPEDRIQDVVLIDPADTGFTIGLNILQAHTDIEREILSSDLVASFRRYATSWGDQMSAVFGNAIQAILENSEGGTLNDLRRFLIEKEFRQTFLKNVTDPTVLYYWQKEFPLLKTNSIGPILTRLDSFLRPRSIRNMVIQNRGIDFEHLINSNKILLFKLSQGLIGMENSFLLGSLLLSKIHQAIFRRQQHTTRNALFLYLDEFHNFITPSIKEMLSGIRKYHVGLTLSHQDLQQLQREDTELLNSVLSNTNNRVVFRVGEPDAKSLQDSFGHFDFTDLQNLGRGEAIIRIEQPQYDCSLITLPLPFVAKEERDKKIESVIAFSRQKYATPKLEVERLLFESLNLDFAKEEKPQVIVKDKLVPKIDTPVIIEPVIINDIKAVETPKQPVLIKEEKDLSTHRYLQTLVKKMAEARGYTAVIEQQLSDGTGQVDVLLAKDGKTIAVEICITTDADWEMHNISKCIRANYDTVVSLSGDAKQLEKIKKKCSTGIADFGKRQVEFLTPDALFAYLDDAVKEQVPQESRIKGYRVKVSYDQMSTTEMKQKRGLIAKTILTSMNRR